MKLYSRVRFFIGVLRVRPFALGALLLALASASVQAAVDPATPAALAQLQSFRGTISYSGRSLDEHGATFLGNLSVSGERWTLEERSDNQTIVAGSDGSWLRTGAGQTLVFDDPLAVGVFANPWALLFGKALGQQIRGDTSGSSWTVGSGVRVYVDAALGRVIGAVDTSRDADVAYAFGDWITVNGVWLPQSITQLRDGVPDASYLIESYQVLWAPNGAGAAASIEHSGTATSSSAPISAIVSPARLAWRSYGVLFVLLFIGLCFVAWTRRDALIARVGKYVAADTREWKDEGTHALVSAEGLLYFEGRCYRIGARFFNRRILVQSSPLFVRISAPDAGQPLVLARKFPSNTFLRLKRSTSAFTLIEALVATALFAGVVVAAVFPALVVLARADNMAAQHEAAVQAATNALADEEAALEYAPAGTKFDTTSATSTVNGMQVIISIAPATTPGLFQVAAQVNDRDGRTLTRIVTMVGPPVPPPSASSSPPP